MFFDSYAFMEIIRGNENYDKYVEHCTPITLMENLYEFHYNVFTRISAAHADEYYDLFSEYIENDIGAEDIKSASRFRAIHKAKKLSYVDALGYVVALRRGIKFLTGDNAFRDLPNVEFVK